MDPLSTLALSRAGTVPTPDKVSLTRPGAGESLKLVLASLDDMKAEDITTIDLIGKTTICDYMVVTSGRSNRHVGAVADNVVKDLHEAGIRNVKVEGQSNCDWVLIDTGDIIVHVFRPEVRTFYNLEKMWSDFKPESGRLS